MANVYPEGYFPIEVKTGYSHNEVIINNRNEMVAFLNSNKYYSMYIGDAEIAMYSKLKNLQIEVFSVRNGSFNCYTYNQTANPCKKTAKILHYNDHFSTILGPKEKHLCYHLAQEPAPQSSQHNLPASYQNDFPPLMKAKKSRTRKPNAEILPATEAERHKSGRGSGVIRQRLTVGYI